jgi:hypothetical protein
MSPYSKKNGINLFLLTDWNLFKLMKSTDGPAEDTKIQTRPARYWYYCRPKVMMENCTESF